MRQCYQWGKAKILPYKQSIAVYGATMLGLPSQIVYAVGKKYVTPLCLGCNGANILGIFSTKSQ